MSREPHSAVQSVGLAATYLGFWHLPRVLTLVRSSRIFTSMDGSHSSVEGYLVALCEKGGMGDRQTRIRMINVGERAIRGKSPSGVACSRMLT